jgi:hypothetical protein
VAAERLPQCTAFHCRSSIATEQLAAELELLYLLIFARNHAQLGGELADFTERFVRMEVDVQRQK